MSEIPADVWKDVVVGAVAVLLALIGVLNTWIGKKTLDEAKSTHKIVNSQNTALLTKVDNLEQQLAAAGVLQRMTEAKQTPPTLGSTK